MSCKNQLHQILAMDSDSNNGNEPYIDTTLLTAKAQQAGKSSYAQKILFWHEILGDRLVQKIKSRYPNVEEKFILNKIKPVLKKIIENDERHNLTDDQKEDVNELLAYIGFSEAEWQPKVAEYEDPVPANAELLQKAYYGVLPEIKKALDLIFAKGDQICLSAVNNEDMRYVTLTIDEIFPHQGDDNGRIFYTSKEIGDRVQFWVDEENYLHFYGQLGKGIDKESQELLSKNFHSLCHKIIPVDHRGQTPVLALPASQEVLSLSDGTPIQFFHAELVLEDERINKTEKKT